MNTRPNMPAAGQRRSSPLIRLGRRWPGAPERERSAFRGVVRLVALPAVRRWVGPAVLAIAMIVVMFGDMLRDGRRKAEARAALEAERAAILTSAAYRLGVEESRRHTRGYASSSLLHFPTNWSDEDKRNYTLGFLGRTNVPWLAMLTPPKAKARRGIQHNIVTAPITGK